MNFYQIAFLVMGAEVFIAILLLVMVFNAISEVLLAIYDLRIRLGAPRERRKP